MSVLTMLYTFFLMPIQLLFETVFSYAYKIVNERAGLAIIALSLAINLLVLPLYRRADAMQEEERLMEAKLHDGVAHIKKAFRGDERTMILQTYYRQNNYSPLYVLRSAVSLFLEIPFFIAAYRFLSELSLIQGVSFGPIADLGKPDSLIVIGGFSINILPILMTAVNIVSTAIFTKGYPLKTKLQLYGMAAFFLVFLYDSPSGLVFYWTLNNLFSLVKTIFYKIKNPKKAIRILMLVIGAIGMPLFGTYIGLNSRSSIRFFVCIGIGIVLCVPFILHLIKSKTKISFPQIHAKPDKKIFWCEAIFLTVLTGLLIPSAVINASPQEFIIIGTDFSPVWFVVSSLLAASGTFILWMGVFYWLFAPKTKVVTERILLAACGVFVADYLFFGNNLGIMSSELVYVGGIKYSMKLKLLNLLVVLAVAAIIILITQKKPKISKAIVLVSAIAMLCMSGINVAGIFSSLSKVDMSAVSLSENQPQLTLSKTQKNVVVFMLDRAMGEYIPYIMDEHPELLEQYEGFTYYSNVISYGAHTNFGAPALFGGYEYTPAEMNKRDTESLQEKHDEALKVMPVLFDQEGYNVTVCDPPYAGYLEVPDLSIYDDYPEINTYITQGIVNAADSDEIISNRYRNFFCFSLVKSAPAILQSTLYDSGLYHQLNGVPRAAFEKSYGVLKALSSITDLQDGDSGCFVMINNETTHNIEQFKDDDYQEVVSTRNAADTDDSITLNGITLDLGNREQKGCYQTNTATLIRLGEWFDYLREQGVYDNTRIILVSDHGYASQQIDELILDDTAYDEDPGKRNGDAESYYPLLMVKDFNGEGFTASDEFMTNADVPTLATADLIESPKNPFTGKTIAADENAKHDPLIIASEKWDVAENNGTAFLPARWYTVHDSIWKKENWSLVAEDAVLQ